MLLKQPIHYVIESAVFFRCTVYSVQQDQSGRTQRVYIMAIRWKKVVSIQSDARSGKAFVIRRRYYCYLLFILPFTAASFHNERIMHCQRKLDMLLLLLLDCYVCCNGAPSINKHIPHLVKYILKGSYPSDQFKYLHLM